MTVTTFSLAALLLAACSSDAGLNDPDPLPEPDPEGWSLVWSDEFDGSGLDNDTWTHWVTGNPYNNELQYYTNFPSNTRVENGFLHLIARDEPYSGPDGRRDYTSSRINTRGNADFKYGRIDVRAKVPIGQGIWPAIWMMPTHSAYGGWPRSGEIDIMELVGHAPATVHGTLHYTDTSGKNANTGDAYHLSEGTFADDFHVFGIEWEEGEIRWYVDGVLYQVQNRWQTQNAPYPAPFDQSFYIILNVAVGGNWPGSPDATTIFPAEMVVDWVRVYEADA